MLRNIMMIMSLTVPSLAAAELCPDVEIELPEAMHARHVCIQGCDEQVGMQTPEWLAQCEDECEAAYQQAFIYAAACIDGCPDGGCINDCLGYVAVDEACGDDAPSAEEDMHDEPEAEPEVEDELATEPETEPEPEPVICPSVEILSEACLATGQTAAGDCSDACYADTQLVELGLLDACLAQCEPVDCGVSVHCAESCQDGVCINGCFGLLGDMVLNECVVDGLTPVTGDDPY